jgi:Subtilase family
MQSGERAKYMKRVAAVATSITLGLGVAAAAGAPSVAHATAAQAATGKAEKVIVVLRDQHSASLGNAAATARRTPLISRDQAPLRAQISRLGGRTTHAYRTLNAVSATVPAGGIGVLRADPDVQAVVPDLTWHLSPPAAEAATRSQATKAVAASRDTTKLCGTAAHPLLEPEALQTTNTSSDDPNAKTARSLGFTGAGVKVAVIADGLDVNQPDLIRADGSHVVVDYQDFSGDGINSDTAGGEEMGDASSVAAQGRTAYDLSAFGGPNAQLPVGCDIRIQGMAPGASLVALKIFSNELLTAPTSAIIQAIDYAVNTDRVDVINESFGANPYPDNATDPISLFNKEAVAAGTTVVASTGDAGSGSTMGTASTDPWVIGAGASTILRSYVQLNQNASNLSNGQWESNQVSSLSSSGISQTNRVMDVLAPGDLGWALCSTALDAQGNPQYQSCGSQIQQFGGTSEAAPLTSGAAALVIQAYRRAHSGASPSPAAVRRILDSSAHVEGLPADEQGAGLLDSYRAVKLAAAMHSPVHTGSALTIQKPYVTATVPGGATVTKRVSVTNTGSSSQRVSAMLRGFTKSGAQSSTVQLDATDPTYTDNLNRTVTFVKKTFTVSRGTARVDAKASFPGAAGPLVRLTLLDPQGRFSAYSLPQGTGNLAHVDIHDPLAGTWTAVLFTVHNATQYTGPVLLRTTDFRASSAGSVTPSNFTLASGAHRVVTIRTKAPSAEAAASSLVVDGSRSGVSSMPVVVRAAQRVSFGREARFSGTFDNGNGRSFSPAQSDTYLFQVPSGAKDLDVTVTTTGTPSLPIVAHLVDPRGEATATDLNQRPQPDNSIVTDPGVQIVHANPQPGRWQLTLELANPVAGAALPQTFTGTASLNGARVTSSGVPTSRHTTVSKAHGSTATITIHNTSPQPQAYFVDPRTKAEASYKLVAVQSAKTGDAFTTVTPLPLQSDSNEPAWLVPTQAKRLTVGAAATDPIVMDVMPLDSPTAINSPNNPDILATSSGNSATAVDRAHEVTSSMWAAFPTQVGPDPAGGSPAGSVTMQASVRARGFDPAFTSSTGDPLLATVSSTAAAAKPLVIPAGGSAVVTVTLKPTGAVGSIQRGRLFVDTLAPFGVSGNSSLVDEVQGIRYAYKIGS